MPQAVVLRHHGDEIWIVDAPDGDELRRELETSYCATGEVLDDPRLGTVRVFHSISHSDHVVNPFRARRRPVFQVLVMKLRRWTQA